MGCGPSTSKNSAGPIGYVPGDSAGREFPAVHVRAFAGQPNKSPPLLLKLPQSTTNNRPKKHSHQTKNSIGSSNTMVSELCKSASDGSLRVRAGFEESGGGSRRHHQPAGRHRSAAIAAERCSIESAPMERTAHSAVYGGGGGEHRQHQTRVQELQGNGGIGRMMMMAKSEETALMDARGGSSNLAEMATKSYEQQPKEEQRQPPASVLSWLQPPGTVLPPPATTTTDCIASPSLGQEGSTLRDSNNICCKSLPNSPKGSLHEMMTGTGSSSQRGTPEPAYATPRRPTFMMNNIGSSKTSTTDGCGISSSLYRFRHKPQPPRPKSPQMCRKQNIIRDFVVCLALTSVSE